MKWRTDCRYFLGEKPCKFKRECPDCPHFEPQGRRILILKLGALGDVLRTTPVLRALHSTDTPSHVTWVVGDAAKPLLDRHPRIDRLCTVGPETSARLAVEEFDLLLSLDKDAYTTSIAMTTKATEKRGFGRDRNGALIPLHAASQYAYDLGLSDQLKFFKNQKTYQEVIFDLTGLSWNHQEYDVPWFDGEGPGHHPNRRQVLEEAGVPHRGRPVVGLNTGAGGVFVNKAWTVEGYAALARQLASDGVSVALLGGAGERARNQRIADLCDGAAFDTGADRTLPEFAKLVGAFDLVVTGDTLGMHLAISSRVPCVVLFGSTCSQEIELYGRGEKVVTPIECHPCYLQSCALSPNCQDMIVPDAVIEACRRILQTIPKDAAM